jgi:hypothetical protein
MIASKLEFKYSKHGSAYIDLGEGQLVFSKITSHPDKGYKYIAYNHRYMDTIVVKRHKTINGKRVAHRETYTVEVHDSHTFNMYFYKDAARKYGIPRDTLIPARLGDWLRRIFAGLIDDEGYMPYKKIRVLERKINNADLDEILKTKIKRKRKRKKAK